MRYKICVYAICKNEEAFVDRWMDSMSEADEIVVTDTGSNDHTVERLRERGATVHMETVAPWRFDVARNRSLAHVPDDVDIAVCTDLDEVFRPGWRRCLERAWRPNITMGNYLYNWSLRDDGTPETQFQYFKVHTKKDYEWRCPVHEYLHFIGAGEEKKIFIPGMVLDHYPDTSKSRSSYLSLLEMAVQETPDNDRMMYYLGREYLYTGQWLCCIETLTHHLALPNARWAEERCASMRWIAQSCQHLGEITEACRWYARAIAEAPHMREPYIEFAQLAYRQKDWESVLALTTAALRITEPSCYINMGYAWDHTPDDLAAIACYQLGMKTRSLAHAEQALSHTPEDERLRNNLACIRESLQNTQCH